MSKSLHDIDELFRDGLEGHEESPLPETWEKVENALNRKDAITYKSKYTKLVKNTRKAGLLLVFLVLVGILKLQFEKFMHHEFKLRELGQHVAAKPGFHSTNGATKIDAPEVRGGTMVVTSSEFQKKDEWQVSNSLSVSRFNADPALPIEKLSSSRGNYSENFISPWEISISNPPRFFLINNDAINKNAVPGPPPNQKTTHRVHRFTLIPYFSFDHNSGRYEEVYKYANQNKSEMLERETPDISTSFGLLGEYGLTDRLSLSSGLTWSNSFTTIAPTVIKAYQDNSGVYKFKLATSYGLAELKKTGYQNPQIGDSVTLMNAEQHLQYVSLPALVKYTVKPGRFNIKLSAGGAFNKIINDKMEVTYLSTGNNEKERIEKIEGLNEAFLSLNGGVEIGYDCTKNINVGITPVFRYSITPVNSGTPVKTFPVAWGLGAMVKINL